MMITVFLRSQIAILTNILILTIYQKHKFRWVCCSLDSGCVNKQLNSHSVLCNNFFHFSPLARKSLHVWINIPTSDQWISLICIWIHSSQTLDNNWNHHFWFRSNYWMYCHTIKNTFLAIQYYALRSATLMTFPSASVALGVRNVSMLTHYTKMSIILQHADWI